MRVLVGLEGGLLGSIGGLDEGLLGSIEGLDRGATRVLGFLGAPFLD